MTQSTSRSSMDTEKQNTPTEQTVLEQTSAPAKSDMAQGPPQDDTKFGSSKFWLIMACNFLSLFLVALDRTVIATAVPRITDEFNSLGDIGWYGSAYMLTCAIAQLVYGRIYKFYNMKVVFLATIVLFEIGSAVCGAAPNSGAFIAGRAIAGIGAAGIFSGTMLIIIPLVPLHKRPMFQAMFGLVFGVASVMGPVIGGGFTDSITWRWCFYVNLPIGGFALVLMYFVWHPQQQARESVSIMSHITQLDPLGMLFFAPAMACLLLALQWGGSTYAWNDGRIIALFVVSAVLLLAFAAVQVLMPDTATVPAKIITQRSVYCAVFFTFFVSSAMMMMIYYLPIWFQAVKLVDAAKSGVYILPVVLALVVASFVSGFMTMKIGYYVPAMLICPCIMSTALGLMTTFNIHTNTSHWIAYQFLAGFGIGFGAQVGGLTIQRVLSKTDVPAGIALIFFSQQMGGAIFTTVGQTILSNSLVSQLSGVAGLDPAQIVKEGATSLASVVPAQYTVVVQQAYNFACTRIFFAAMGISFAALLCAFGIEWLSIKKGKNGQTEDGHDAKPTGEGKTQTDGNGVSSEKAESV